MTAATGHSFSDNVDVRRVSTSVGQGVFVKSYVPKAAMIYSDSPFVSIQHTANRRFVKACQNCHRPLGSIKDQLATVFDEDRFRSSVDLSVLDGHDSSVPHVNCECGELYCSPECGADAYRKHHYCLCVSHSGGASQAVSDFKFYCLSIEGCGDNLLLLSQLLAVCCSRSDGSTEKFYKMLEEILTFTNVPFNEVARPPSGSDRDEEWNQWLESTITEAFNLLASALAPQNTVFQSFFADRTGSFAIMSRILAMFELNNIDIAITTKLKESVANLSSHGVNMLPLLRQKEVVMRLLWNDEARGIYEDDDEEDEIDDEMEEQDEGGEVEECCDSHHDDNYVDELIAGISEEVAQMSLAELLDSEFPSFHGTGFFTSVARTNHSCDPNIVMDFDNGNATVCCKALRDIGAGEELRMSYIARPETKSKAQRHAQLKDYLFECSCSKCQQEVA
jgi:hypothetical protein